MGGQQSKEEEDYFVLEHLSKITLKNRKIVSYYFIEPSRTPAIQTLLTELRNYFKIQYFATIKTLQQQMNFIHKNQIVKVIMPQNFNNNDMNYLQSQNKVSQILIHGKKSALLNPWSKLMGFCQNKTDFLTLLNNLEEKDSLQISPSMILVADQDTKMLNRYRLNFQCNTNFKNREKAKIDLLELAKKIYTQQANLISQFEANYKLSLTGLQKRKMILSWIFKDSFYWQLVSTISKNTTNPKRLAYIRLALKDIFQTIKQQYKQRKKTYKEYYIIIELSQQQKIKLQKSKEHCILFTSFIKGYTSQKEATKIFKSNPNSFMFNIPPNRMKLDEQLDFGFIVDQATTTGQNVIFNIYNVFRVEEINIKTREGTILYGVLPMNYLNRLIPKEQRPKMTKFQIDLMRNYDYLQDLLAKVDSQAQLLQLAGYHKEGLQVFDKKVDFIRKTNESQQNMNKCLIKKGDALRISGDYDTAQKQYESIFVSSQKMKLISQIHLAELYMHKGQDDKFDKLIEQVYSKIDQLKEHESQEYFKAKNLYIVNLIKKGKKSSLEMADKLLKNLQIEVSNKYPNNFEGKTLVHDIYRSKATCLSKLGKNQDALSLLKTTLDWQLTCQGNTPNVALTQTLIQSVCKSSGNKDEYQKSQFRMSTMSSQIQSSQHRFESILGTNLNKSLINISI